MKYICPHCRKYGTYKWWKTKQKLKCPYCNNKIFVSIEKKLNILSFFGSLLGTLSAPIIFIFLKLELGIYKKLLIFLLYIVTLFLIILVIELRICRNANNKVVNR